MREKSKVLSNNIKDTGSKTAMSEEIDDKKIKQDCEKRKENKENDVNPTDALLAQTRKGVQLNHVNNEVENAKTPGNNKDGKSQDFSDELKEKLKSRRKGIVGKDNVQQQNNEVCQNQSQDLQEAKELGHGNTPTSSFSVIAAETPIVPPPPPPPSAPGGINSLKKTNGSDKPGPKVSNNPNHSTHMVISSEQINNVRRRLKKS
ncbi:hypothetical protein [Wolbachia endosymbiont (group B) of Ischnura elegans]|uniref:hypothetical protein n=1 Tax=Wolbachia endosymbiont (group B) of Ischnura elegans TaxID=2954021 RepID=UPI002230B662|nr:hypothetical protein [Wolbachia endosymbiont (group B) of Ischnura elegans]